MFKEGKGKAAAMPITIRGVEYPSQHAAAKAVGVSPVAIHKAKIAGRLDTVGLKPARTEAVPVSVRGEVYRSQYAAAKALNLSKTTIYNALERGTLDRVGMRKGI